jgi:hypothetical protein
MGAGSRGNVHQIAAVDARGNEAALGPPHGTSGHIDRRPFVIGLSTFV